MSDADSVAEIKTKKVLSKKNTNRRLPKRVEVPVEDVKDKFDKGLQDVERRYKQGIERVEILEEGIKKEFVRIQELQQRMPALKSRVDSIHEIRTDIKTMLDDAKVRWYQGEMGEMLMECLPRSRMAKREVGNAT
eukprot:GFYU01017018.1.p1 GENE.GFYU01017018.1~~GFYU01017018.1.p1  ORF type:complete len:135 (-),score=35.96 GFYU01017018.1:52-456(-)